MKKKWLLIIGVFPLMLHAQSLSLDECTQLAHDHYPMIRQYDLIEQSRDYTIDNASKAWLPRISASVNGMAFTDILNPNPAMKQMGVDTKNWVASGSVTITQNIYDGGQTAARKQMAQAQAEMEKHQTHVGIYDINNRICQLYFGILTLDEQIKQTSLLRKDIDISYQTVSSMMKGGIANQSDLDAVQVEQLKADQQLDAQQSSREAYLRMLGYFIGRNLDSNTQLTRPSAEMPAMADGLSSKRPEIAYYQAQTQLLDAKRQELDAKLLPTLSAFGTGMYHTQVSDMVKNGLLAGGLTLSWNIGALYTRKNDLHQLDVQRQKIETQQQTFLFNNRLQNENCNGTITRLQRLIQQDEEIVNLRERIRSKSESKVKLGTESVNEMLRDINEVAHARQQKALHEIELLKEYYTLKNINNE